MEDGQQLESVVVLEQRLDWLQQQAARDAELQALHNSKAAAIFRQVEVTARSLADQAERDKAELQRVVAGLEYDLSKGRVELLRWRQRSALLKVQLSSAEEDVKRYRRVGALLLRQYEMEQAAGLATRESVVAAQLATASTNARQAAARREELQAAQAGLQEGRRRVAQLQQELLHSSQQESELERQLKAAHAQQAQQEHSIAAAGNSAAALQCEAGRLKADKEQLERQRAAMEAVAAQRLLDAEELQRCADKLQREATSKGLEISILQAQLAAEVKQRAELAGRLATEEKQKAELAARLAAEEKQRAELLVQLKAKRAQISKLEDEAAARTVDAFVSSLESPLMVDTRLDAERCNDNDAGRMEPPRAVQAVELHSHPASAAAAAAAGLEPEQQSREAPAAAKKKAAAKAQAGQRKVGQKDGLGLKFHAKLLQASAQLRKGKQEVALAAADDGLQKEHAAKDVGRPQRERSKVQPYWVGMQQVEAKAAEQPTGREQNVASPAGGGAAGLEQLAAAAGEALAEATRQGSGAEEPVVEDAAKVDRRVRRKGHLQQLVHEHQEEQHQHVEEPEQAGDKAPASEAKQQKKKPRKAPLKRPQGEIKTNLTSVWGGATPGTAGSDSDIEQGGKAAKPSRRSNLAPKSSVPDMAPEAADSSPPPQQQQQQQQQPAPRAVGHGNEVSKHSNRGSQGSAASLQQREQELPSSRVLERPLAVLNQRTLAAAANMMQRPAGPLKSSLQKAIAARGDQPQHIKRKLLPASTSAYAAAAADVIPADALFGGFKVPKLMK